MIKTLFSVAGKVVLVTGGSRGIGAMIARGFVEGGARTYIVARKEEECRRTAEELSQSGECIAIPGDLSTLAGIHALVDAFSAREKALQVLVNNTGTVWGAKLQAFPEQGWDKVLNLNLKTPFFLTQQLLTQLKQGGQTDDPARVINIASMHGIAVPEFETYSYSASKAGLIHLTKHLALQLVQEGINVNSLAPGIFWTKMTDFADRQAVLRSIPRGRTGSPEDIAGAAIYLASRAGAWVTGVTIPVDGGSILQT